MQSIVGPSNRYAGTLVRRCPGAPVRRHAGALVLLFAALAGCSLGESQKYYGVFVHGTISAEAGHAVPGVNVRIAYTAQAECAAPFIHMVSEPTTDSTGYYGLTVVETDQLLSVCVKVVATPPTDSALVADSVTIADVPFTEGLGSDSLRIDIVLPPTPTTR